ncbi:hypothetical protein M8C13_18750 [Crossiella sp. SN42]|uniref:hypothetical protein n=1 Tax=Crossiella sp. SN42 TaxID=2944808 RepID=UPI00207D2834|nr:hypothetical protein [Crossiella sp. SN42]MCO1577798.1 hypothetical protein [Crossiella sp. SN42]
MDKKKAELHFTGPQETIAAAIPFEGGRVLGVIEFHNGFVLRCEDIEAAHGLFEGSQDLYLIMKQALDDIERTGFPNPANYYIKKSKSQPPAKS